MGTQIHELNLQTRSKKDFVRTCVLLALSTQPENKQQQLGKCYKNIMTVI